MRIGLALSGGGVRALSFHLGVVARLAADSLLESVSMLSTVSGGSLATGLIYSQSGNRWPASDEYLRHVLPAAKQLLTSSNLEHAYIIRRIRQPWRLGRGRATYLADSISRLWGVTGSLRELPTAPRWAINATTYETGKSWRFSHQRMGDYTVGYVEQPDFPVAQAISASAAFPGLIGPLTLRPKDFKWSAYAGSQLKSGAPAPDFEKLTLWDGGIYDNLGVEALLKTGAGPATLRDEINYLIVSDASISNGGAAVPGRAPPSTKVPNVRPRTQRTTRRK